MGEHATPMPSLAEHQPDSDEEAARRSAPTATTARLRARLLQGLEAIGPLGELRELAAQTGRDVLTRAGHGTLGAGSPPATAPARASAGLKAAPVISLASHARKGWRLASAARRNKTPIGIVLSLVGALAVLLAIRRRRRRRE